MNDLIWNFLESELSIDLLALGTVAATRSRALTVLLRGKHDACMDNSQVGPSISEVPCQSREWRQRSFSWFGATSVVVWKKNRQDWPVMGDVVIWTSFSGTSAYSIGQFATTGVAVR